MNTEGRKLELLTGNELDDLLDTLLKEKARRNRVEELKIIANLSKALEDFAKAMPDETIYVDVWCEECETDIEVDITEYFNQIAVKLDNLK
jgi:hypothetical protein